MNCIVELEVRGVALIQSEGRVPVPLSIALNEKVRGLAAGSIVKDASVNVYGTLPIMYAFVSLGQS